MDGYPLIRIFPLRQRHGTPQIPRSQRLLGIATELILLGPFGYFLGLEC